MCRLSCNTGRSDGIRTPRKTIPQHHTSLRRWYVALILRRRVLWQISAVCELRWKSKMSQKSCYNANDARVSDTPSVTAAMLGVWHPSGKCHLTPQQQHRCCSSRENQTANYRGCIKLKEAKKGCCKASARAATERIVSPRAWQRPNQPYLSLFPKRKTGLWLQPRSPRWPRCQCSVHAQSYPHFIRYRKTDRKAMLPQRAANVSPRVPEYRRWIPTYPVPNWLTQQSSTYTVNFRLGVSPISWRTFPPRSG